MTKITKLILITLILSLGFGQLLRLELFDLPVYLHDILVIIILVFNFRKERVFTPPLWFKLIALGLIIGAIRALALFPIAELAIPALYSLRLLAYLTLYLLLRHKSHVISRLVFILSGAITLAIGLTQYIFMPDMRIFQYLGWDDHLSRLTLPHFDPTFTGAILVMNLLYSLHSPLIHNPIFIILYALTVLLTYSRSIWLSLVLTTFVFVKNKVFLLLAICSMLFAIYLLPNTFGEGTNLLRTFSITSRLEHDLSLVHDVGWNLVTGIGYNTLSLVNPSDSQYPNHAASFNNSFLTILATSGVAGLVGWLLFLRSLYINHYQLRYILVFVIFGSLFNNLLLYPFVLIYLILISVFEN